MASPEAEAVFAAMAGVCQPCQAGDHDDCDVMVGSFIFGDTRGDVCTCPTCWFDNDNLEEVNDGEQHGND